MASLDEKYALEAEDREVLATQIKDLDSEGWDAFAKNIEVLLRDKSREVLAKKEDEASKEVEVEEESKQQINQVAAQYGGQIPPEVQVEMQQEIESQVSEKIAEMTDEMVPEEAEMLQEMSQDPLVGLKQQEINLRAQDLERKSLVDEAKIGIDEQKLRQDAQIAQDRINSQEDIAQLRANVNLTKQKEIEKSKKRPRTVDVNKNIRFDN